MPYYYTDVQRFHDKFGLATPEAFRFLPQDLHVFRVKFLEEEYQEYVDSCKSQKLGQAIDALLDLVYVCCGTLLLHGVSPAEFDNIVIDEDDIFDVATHTFSSSGETYKAKPHFLSPAVNAAFTYHLGELINKYALAHADTWSFPFNTMNDAYSIDNQKPLEAREHDIKKYLGALYLSCLAGADLMGMPIEMWDEMWDDVQRANMAKERVLKAEDSKRGSTWDVRKPPGWVGPRTEEILQKWLA